MQQDTCIHWSYHGSRCKNKMTQNTKYCKRHKQKHQYIFEIMSIKQHIKSEEDIYEILKHIYDNDTYDSNGTELSNDSDSKKELFLIILKYLLPHNKLLNILHNTLIPITTKKTMLNRFHDILYNTYKLSHDESICQKVSKIQTWFRKILHKHIKQYNTETPENNEDPFTYDSIQEIPEKCKFSYKDTNGHVYIFNAIELEYFIRHQGAWNPYTKESLSSSTVNRLYLLMQYNGLKPKTEEDVVWQTSTHAFTEVSQLMEEKGFYNDVVWFDKLTLSVCNKVIKIYRDMCTNITEGHIYFPFGFEISEINYVFVFCKEVIRLFKEADEHYLLCCNFVKALALNIEEFYNNLPSWLLNIESPITFLNDDNALFYMYVRNLLDGISTLETEFRTVQHDYDDENEPYAFNFRYHLYR
jgi:hypothetical protein